MPVGLVMLLDGKTVGVGHLGFFFQAEDGIRDVAVTGVQTCALPIWPWTQQRVRACANVSKV